VIVGAIVLMRVARYGGMWIYAIVAFPGTLAHELSHYLVAFVLGGHPTFPSLIPVREGRAWRLGQVQCRAGRIRGLFVGLAPLLLLPLAYLWAAHFLVGSRGAITALHAWVIAAFTTRRGRRVRTGAWRCRRFL